MALKVLVPAVAGIMTVSMWLIGLVELLWMLSHQYSMCHSKHMTGMCCSTQLNQTNICSLLLCFFVGEPRFSGSAFNTSGVFSRIFGVQLLFFLVCATLLCKLMLALCRS